MISRRYLLPVLALLLPVDRPLAADVPDPARSKAAVEALESADGPLDPALAATPLTKDDAARARKVLIDRRVAHVRETRAGEFQDRRIEIDGLAMPFSFKVFGEKPEGGRSLYLSMHGGGNAPPRVNDRQYENQKGLYEPAEGIYLAPRAPTDTWDLWHQSHVDKFFERLIEDLSVFEGVDFDKVYLMGYSAGGDGVYQLAPRMADRLAAASMMAGHPNEASPLGLRNLPFAIHVGADDAAYNRNKVTREWGDKLDRLREDDPSGYLHLTEIHPGRGHWMNREDASAVPWMAKFRRDPIPNKVVWYQDNVTRGRFYWLAVEDGQAQAGASVVADREGQEVRITKLDGVDRLIVRLDDRMLDLDRPVTIKVMGDTVFEGLPSRTIATLARTLEGPGDPGLTFAAEIVVTAPKK
ncbi:alpha/beta hydrolase [Tundrisphaera lichenicola]|uniref:alpha/beta hydrolase n=1 Tax=Tundrisphaera lichenicola TaxID=2029860 RepID=UPI003EB69887